MKNDHIKNLYLHVGMSKTATSSIQDTLYINRKLLEESDYFYSKTLPKNHSDVFRMLFGDEPEEHHTSIKHGLDAKKIESINAENAKAISHEISQTTCSNLIFSGESIFALKKRGLEKLKAFFEELTPTAKVIILLSTRNPVDFINSAAQQKKRSSMGLRFAFNILEKTQNLSQVFGKENILAFKFEDACANKLGPPGHFLDLIDLPKSVLNEIEIINSNSSVSDKAIDIIDFVNQAVPMISDGHISRGRIHLDYAHFHVLTGNKFQLGKAYFEENIGIQKMASYCKWLKQNLDIEYSVKDVPEQPPRIVYDPVFSEEIKSLYPFLTPVLKKLTSEYVNNRRQSESIDSISRKTLTKLSKWITVNYKDTEESSLKEIITQQRAHIAKDKKHRNQLLKRFKGDDIRAAQFLRDIALFLEHYEMIDQSKFFMGKAKMYSPDMAVVNDKLVEYQAILESEKKTSRRLFRI